MAVILTDEMRAAVHDEDCARLGHDIAVDNALVVADQTTMRPDVGSHDPTKMPYLYCRRCGRVWLVLEDVGIGYADAVSRLAARLIDPTKTRVKP